MFVEVDGDLTGDNLSSDGALGTLLSTLGHLERKDGLGSSGNSIVSLLDELGRLDRGGPLLKNNDLYY